MECLRLFLKWLQSQFKEFKATLWYIIPYLKRVNGQHGRTSRTSGLRGWKVMAEIMSVQVPHAATLWSALGCRKTLRLFSKRLDTFHSALLKISVMLEVIDPISGAENLKNILFILRNIHFNSCVGLLTTMVVWICFVCFYRGVKAMACFVSLLCIVGHSVVQGDITDLEDFLGKLFPGRGQEL